MLWLSPTPGGYQKLDKAAYYHQLLRNLSTLPGVVSVTLSHTAPTFFNELQEPITPMPRGSHEYTPFGAFEHVVAPGFFKTFGIALLEGRDFSDSDDPRTTRVAILSADLARKLFPLAPATGNWIRFGEPPQQRELQVIGVVGDASLYNVRLHKPDAVYLPFFQTPTAMNNPLVQIRSEADNPAALGNAARGAIASMGHEYAWRTQTLADQVDQSIVQERLLGILSGGFAVLALLLTAIGLFGSISCRVTQRTREIGIRMALGARKKEVFCLVMKDSLLPVAAGIIVGLAGSVAASHLISHLLYEIGPTDPPIFLASVAAVLLSGILAAYLPASRATGLAPSSALRSE